jgi:hypothetical protein
MTADKPHDAEHGIEKQLVKLGEKSQARNSANAKLHNSPTLKYGIYFCVNPY